MTKRKGFTLIELMVVIAIIAVLATLAIGATMRYIASQKEANTRTIFSSLDKDLQRHWAKVIADAKAEPSGNISAAVWNMAITPTFPNGDPNLARIIWIKMRLMEAFPTTYAEIDTVNNPLYLNNYIPAGLRKYIASYQKKLAGSTPVLVNKIDTQSAACLLIALSVPKGNAKAFDPDSIASNLGQEVLANGTKQNQFIIDGWGNPVLFFRFPTPDLSTWSSLGGMDPQSNNPAKKTSLGSGIGADPADPEGKLQNPNWNNGGAGVSLFESICHPVHTAAGPFAWYITPVIASAGSDGVPGLTANFSINNVTNAGDNIYNYLLRFGATGN
jgi:prepilin-type N-terminal cleavage/methylation domain-containing protein